MTILAGLGSSTGMIAGGVATLAAVAVATTVIVKTNGDDAPVVLDVPASTSMPNEDILTASVKTPSEVLRDSAPAATGDGASLGETPVSDQAGVSLGDGQDLNVSATVIGNTIVASSNAQADVALSTSSADVPKVTTNAKSIGGKDPLHFDLVRVDKYGATVVAGKARAGQIVEIFLDGEMIVQTKADKKGSFVALFDIPASENARVITMAARDENGIAIRSSDRVLVAGRKAGPKAVATAMAEDNVAIDEMVNEAAPQVIIASDEGVKILQPAAADQDAPEAAANVSLDLISYDDQGEVVLTGRGKAENHVRIYVDDQPVKTEPVNKDGGWQLSLPEVNAGVYTLRVDEIDGEGQVTSRLETPFQKEQPDAVKRIASAAMPDDTASPDKPLSAQQITIQPGATLWALAEAKYGQGALYLQIFEANRDNIRNPDLIYPGQIFEIPG